MTYTRRIATLAQDELPAKEMVSEKVIWAEGYPVCYRLKDQWLDFPIKLRWQAGLWQEIFDKHVEYIVEAIRRAKAEGRLIMYLSCPISSRGGGCSHANINVATKVAEKLKAKWGSRLWVLNPALYQLESPEGTGHIKHHAYVLGLEKKLKQEIAANATIDVDWLAEHFPVTGGDYMRMWSRVLIEDGDWNLGNRFDAIYFVGPNDVWDFFADGGENITDGVETHFARLTACHPDLKVSEKEFFLYYSLKASAHFSLGSHDEYNIWRALNRLRVEEFGIPSQIAGYFDGRQIGLGAAEANASLGYATSL